MQLTKTNLVKSLFSIAFFSFGLGFVGCNGDTETQSVAPASAGKRGENCEARNDCASGLACVNNKCAQNEFKLDPKAKVCVPHQCDTTKDCCGDKLSEAPAKCANKVSICETFSVPGCSTFDTCTSAAECNGGTCNPGYCSNSGVTLVACTGDAVCEDSCNEVTGFCNVSGDDCSVDSTVCTTVGTCVSRECDCTNPDYDPAAEICTDPDCEDLCTFTCQDNICDSGTCKTDDDCFGDENGPICNEGACVQCKESADCDEENGFACTSDHICKKPCKADVECPLFAECQANGECKQVGCKSNLECVLYFGSFLDEEDGIDPRLAVCVTVEGQDVMGCKIPCETDTECGGKQVCSNGACTNLGCNDDTDCRADHPFDNGQVVTDDIPFVTTYQCKAPTTATN